MRAGLILLSVIALLAAGQVAGEGIAVSQSIDETSVAFEDSVRFEIVLTWDGPQTGYLFGKPLSPYFDRLKVRGFSSSISSVRDGVSEVTTKRFVYTLIPTSSGQGSIDPVTISYLQWPDSIPGELLTEPMTVTIAMPLPQQEATGESGNWWIVAIGVIVVGAAGGGFMFYRRSHRPTEVVRLPKDQLLDDLTVLKKKEGTDPRQFKGGLYDLLSAYLAAAYELKIDSCVDADLRDLLREKGLPEEKSERLADWLIDARRAKFSPSTGAPGEAIRLESEVRSFFETMPK